MNVRRILDANANRAREALRVMEEAARFLLNDADLAGQIKDLRHDFAAAVRLLGPIELHRDTPGDVGTALTSGGERQRGGVADVVIAAGKRLTEALRSLEEYSKLVDADAAAVSDAFKQLRYRAYDVETALHRRLAPRSATQWRVCVIITEALCTHLSWLDVAKASLDGGADCLQLREKDLVGGELLDRARRLVELAAPGGAAVIVNDRPDVALLAGAAGVHLGEHDLPLAEARRLAGRQLLIGASTHSLKEARAAVSAGTDYCGVGAIFPTATKPRKPSGLKYLEQFIAKFPRLPHLAIGGITPGNVAEVAASGGRGVAVSSIVCGAKKPATIVRQLRRAL